MIEGSVSDGGTTWIPIGNDGRRICCPFLQKKCYLCFFDLILHVWMKHGVAAIAGK